MRIGLTFQISASRRLHRALLKQGPTCRPEYCRNCRCCFQVEQAVTNRRSVLASSTAVWSTVPLLVVSGGQTDAGVALPGYASVSAALAEAKGGSVIRISKGVYRERLVLTRPVTLQAWPEGTEVTIVWETRKPYESVLESSTTGVLVRGLRLRHSSPSVANNFGVFMRSGSLRLEGCDISSATGSGVGTEGGALTLVGCSIHGCKGHGVALFGGLEEDTQGTATVEGCRLEGNGQNGLLIMDNASASVKGNVIAENGAYGVCIRDGEGVIEDNVLQGNRLGSQLSSP